MVHIVPFALELAIHPPTQKDQMRANVPSSNVRFCFPPMNGYGAMHAKIQLLKFPGYLRIAIPSGNLTRYDWGETGVLENVSGTTPAYPGVFQRAHNKVGR